MNSVPPQNNPETSQPWWAFGHMWLVVGGPLAVVVASFITIYLAVTRPDPVYTGSGAGAQPVPAMQSRNHAATGGNAPQAGDENPGSNQK